MSTDFITDWQTVLSSHFCSISIDTLLLLLLLFQTFITLTENCSMGQHSLQNWPMVLYSYKLYKIQPTGPARRLATQQVEYNQQRKSTAAAQISATLTISFPCWCQMSLTSYSGQQRIKFNVIPSSSALISIFFQCRGGFYDVILPI